MKKQALSLLIASMCVMTACSHNTHTESGDKTELKQLEENQTNTDDGKETHVVGSDEGNNKTENTDVENKDSDSIQSQLDLLENNITDVDYSAYFNGLDGCAVFYEPQENKLDVYNKSMINTEISPFSTFKIVSTLMGLKNGVLQNEDSTMEYNNKKYPIEQWNRNLSLKEAFESSCVWYFRQVIDKVGQDQVQKELDELDYGNRDISEWKGSSFNPDDELSGFWLDSSLKISPVEQVLMMKKIFEGESQFSKDQVDLLKKIMLYDEADQYKVYGKTGTRSNQEGWYVGYAVKDDKNCYFAVYVNGEESGKEATGKAAREIVTKIFTKR